MSKQSLGKWGENIALEYLKANNYEIIETNKNHYQNGKKLAEVDIVATKNNILYIMEVKTRSENIFGLALESLTSKKIETLKVISHSYNTTNQKIRIQLIAIDKKKYNDYRLQIVDIF